MMEKVNILWTGGWDSTYRVLRLSSKPVVIQPYYLKDNRQSEELEIHTIKSIINEINELPRAKCIILDPILKNVVEVTKDNKITNAYNNLYESDNIGSQYEWLACFAKNVTGLELCVEQLDDFTVIKNNGAVIKKEDSIKGQYYVIDEESSTKDLSLVYGRFHFPLLSTSKIDMKEWAEKNGLMDIMNKTWFCHHPINDKPCGICHPCIIAIEHGLEYRFDRTALQRYRFNKIIPSGIKKSRYYKKIKNLYRIFKNRKDLGV